MQKTLKRILALILAVMLCLGAMPFSAFAVDAQPDDAVSSEGPHSKAPAESSPALEEPSPEPSAESAPTPENSPTPTVTSEPTKEPEISPSPSEEPTTEPDDGETSGTELPVTRIWPTSPRKARSASFGTNGTLYMGDECCPGGVGTPPTLGKYVGTMSVITMQYGGKHVAGYCLEQARFVP